MAHDHVVHFYGREQELVDDAGDYLARALDSGGSALVVATAEHRDAFAARLTGLGIDVPAALTDGTLLLLDADAVLRRFLRTDRPDAGLFDSVVGGLVRQMERAGRPVHVYGEMVALLWDAGQVNAALEVEALWNDLGRRMDFSLYCSYSAGSVAGEDHREAFAEVCRLHSDVVGEVADSFPATPDAPRAARHFVLATLQRCGQESVLTDAALAVTELATNAVVHARSPFTVRVAVRQRTVTIAVRDASPTAPTPGDAQPFDSSGRGLGLVAALAAAWGAEPLDGGKVVWVELRS